MILNLIFVVYNTAKEYSEMLVGLALRLTDIAGDYATLTALLLMRDRLPGATTSVACAVARIAEEQVLPGDRAAYLRLLAHINNKQHKSDVQKSVRELMQVVLQERLNLGALGCTTRKKNLTLEAASPLPESDATAVSALSVAESAQKEHFIRTGNAQGPSLVLSPTLSSSAALSAVSTVAVLGPRALGLLALDLLEDFMAVNLQLEMCATTTADLAGGDSGGASDTAAAMIASGGLYMGRALPESWVDSVGVGSKEHEHVMAYFRFSDVAFQSDEGFYCSSLRPAGSRLVFTDLSRFEGPGLELYSTISASSSSASTSSSAFTGSSVRVEYSTSPVDPGEKHDNVKSLCDVVFCGGATAETAETSAGAVGGVQHGLRCPVPRGSQLDIGLYHEDSNRSRLTLELMVCFDEAVAMAAQASGDSSAGVVDTAQVLLQRQVADSERGSEGSVLWTLFVTPDGAVCFKFGDIGGGSADGGAPSVLKSVPESVALPTAKTSRSNLGGGSGEGSSWTHIALMLDSSKATCSIAGDGSVLSQAPVNVTLVVKGESVEGKLAPAPIPLAQLDQTTLHVGRNLAAGFRLTELRFWADVRSTIDLDNMRDNYLVLAMKRKRLQLRVKGTKKLFTAYREIEVPSTACTVIKAPAAQDKTAAEEAEDKAAVTSALSGSTAKVLPKALVSPLSKTLQTVTIVTPALSAPSAAKEAPSDNNGTSIPAPAPAPAMSARERRLSMLKGAATAVVAANAFGASIGSGAAATVTSTSSLAPPPPAKLSKPGKAPQQQLPSVAEETTTTTTTTAGSAPQQKQQQQQQQAEKNTNSSSLVPATLPSKEPALEAAPSTPTKVPFTAAATASAEATPSAGAKSMGSPNPTGAPRPVHSVANCCSVVGRLASLVNSTDANELSISSEYEHCVTARAFALPHYWLQCLVPRTVAGQASSTTTTTSSASDQRGLRALSLGNTDNLSTAGRALTSALPAEVQRATESAILTTVAGASDPSKALLRLAVLANNCLSVYLIRTTIDSTAAATSVQGGAELTAQLPLSAVKLVYWSFISPDMILMVSSTAGFTLKVTPPPGSSNAPTAASATAVEVFKPKPMKIFDRIDLVEPLK